MEPGEDLFTAPVGRIGGIYFADGRRVASAVRLAHASVAEQREHFVMTELQRHTVDSTPFTRSRSGLCLYDGVSGTPTTAPSFSSMKKMTP